LQKQRKKHKKEVVESRHQDALPIAWLISILMFFKSERTKKDEKKSLTIDPQLIDNL